MLVRANKVIGMKLTSLDGELGKVKDFFLDDRDWAVRYIVADTDGWLSGRRVLLAPQAFEEADKAGGNIPVKLTREQIETSPVIDEHKPVSRQRERMLHEHYNWAPYWPTYTYVEGAYNPVRLQNENVMEDRDEFAPEENHLRSAAELKGYTIHAQDGELGHCEDFILDEDEWSVRQLIIDTRKWLPGRHVVVPVDWVSDVQWKSKEIAVKVSRERIREAPELDERSLEKAGGDSEVV